MRVTQDFFHISSFKKSFFEFHKNKTKNLEYDFINLKTSILMCIRKKSHNKRFTLAMHLSIRRTISSV